MKRFILSTFTTLAVLSAQAQCSPSISSAELNINNVQTTVLAAGDMWWNGVDAPGYGFPLNSTTTIPNIIFTGGIWLSAVGSDGSLKMAAQMYRSGHDFWTGPIGNCPINSNHCDLYDRHWTIYRTDIDNHINTANNSTLPLDPSSIDASILEWPAFKNQHITSQGYFIGQALAPFEDVNNNGFYDPEYGDYPKVKGDQAIFWVMNDIGNDNTVTFGESLGVEIQCMAYAYSTNDVLDNSTFYDFKVINKSGEDLYDFYLSQFVDPDLGDFSDDYVGCDTSRNLGYFYNSSSVDAQFGTNIPVGGVSFIHTPQDKQMSSFGYFNNGACATQCDPDAAPEFRNYQEGKWKDGSSFTSGGDGYGGSTPTKFIYPGNPGDNAQWSECSAGNAPDDRRFLMTSAAYDLPQGECLDFTIGVVAHLVQNYTACPDIDALLGTKVDEAKSLLGNDVNPFDCFASIDATCAEDSAVYPAPVDTTSLLDLQNSDFITIFPNPSTGKIIIEGIDISTISSLVVCNLEGKTLVRKDSLTENHLDLSTLEDGIYFMQIISKNGQHLKSKKIILSH